MESLGDQKLATLLDALATKTPAPGGGAAASTTGATAAALAGMVVAYSLGKKTLAEHQDTLTAADARLAEIRAEFLNLAAEDAAAYAALNELQRLPDGDPRREADEPAAILRAVDAPSRALDLSLELLTLVERLVGKTNTYLRSDLAIAAVLAEAAAASASWNVRINIPLLPDHEHGPLSDRLGSSLAGARVARERIERACGLS